VSTGERNRRRSLREDLEEWQAAGWAIQSWIRSCFDTVGICALCGSENARVHHNGCPWPRMRALLDRSPLPGGGAAPVLGTPGGRGYEGDDLAAIVPVPDLQK
jgi:hypothetical protein